MQIKSILMALAVTLGVAALSTACATQPQQSAAAPSAQPTPPPNSPASTKPTIVELHGAFEDASSWSKVTRQLQSEGFSVIAPAVQLRGVASDTAALEGVISAIQGPKILVGHSYGGLLVSELASRTPDVTALVYVAAFIPQAGDTAGQLNSQFAGSLLGPATTHMVSSPDGAEMYVNTASFQEFFAAGSAAADAAVNAASQRPILAAAFDEKVAATAPAQIRKYAIVATEDKAIPPAAERFEAQRAGAVITDVRSPHAVPMTNPQAVVDVIHQAAGA
jgi:pimeloyl-ACP methyl ester carboxylesterase